ncbi:MAG: PKD domain-containing protein [Bacteroidia bacterium]
MEKIKKGTLDLRKALISYLIFSLLISISALAQSGSAQHAHATVASSEVPIQQIKNDCKFFSGDTLNGFALEATIEEGIKKFDMYSELKWYVGSKEIAFVKSKYNIEKLPFEIAIENNNKRLVIHPRVANAACNNVDFASGTFTNWTGTTGYNANSNAALTTSTGVITTLGLNSPEPGCSFHTMMSAAGGTDPIGGFPVISPGGAFAVRLGGENINTNNEAGLASCTVNYPSGNPAYYSNGETLETTFAVTTSNTLFTYYYAVVIMSATHPNGEQPYFRIEVLDNTGTSIPCLSYYVQGDSLGNFPPGWHTGTSTLGYASYYLPWQQSSLNLLPYLGTNVTVRFTAAGCIPGGHFGYGYVDCACAPMEIIIPKFACQGGIDSLIAPPVSGSTYAWTGPGIVGGATSQIATASVSGTYSVTITNALGCHYTLDTTLIFYPTPTVTVTTNPICSGGTNTLTVNSTGSAGALTYTWNPSVGLTFSPGDSMATATPSVNTSYSVTGTSVHGCTNTAVANVVVNAAAPATFTAPTVCIGSATSFTNTTVGGSIFNWNFGDIANPQDTSTQQNPSYTYPSSGNYAVSLTVTTTAGCISHGTQTVSVISNPTATFSAPAVCLGNATVFTSTITNGNTYNWTFGDGNTNTSSATPSNTYTSSGTFPVSLTVTAAGGCSVTATNSVVVNPLPTASFTVAPVCQGTGSVFNNTSTLDTSCAWNFGGAGNPAAATTNCTPTFTYLASGTFPVTLTVTSAAGCTATVTGNAVVNPFPTLAFTADHPCDGTAMNFTNTTTNQASISNWSWNLGDGSTNATASPPAHTYSAAGCYSVVLTATASTGCAGSFSATVNVHPNPTAFFNALEPCLGSPSDFMDSSFVVNPACLTDNITSWHWDFGDGGTATYTIVTDTVKHTYATCGPKNITLTITTNNNCTNINTMTGDTVFCLPVVSAPPSFSICPGMATAPQTFTSTVVNGGPAFTVWYTKYPLTNTGMTIVDTLGFDVFPSYTTIPKNMSCTPVSDWLYGVAASTYCIGNKDSLKISVYPTPYLQHMLTDSICANQSITIPNFTACPVNSTTTWTNSNTTIGLAANGTGNIGTFTGLNTSNTLNTATINAVPTANGCVGNDSSFTIVVKPIPTMVASGSTVCPGDTVPSPTFTTNPTSGVNYNWTASNNTGIGMPASGTGTPAAYTAPTNTTLTNQIGIVTYTPSLNGCAGPSATDTINIKPTPYVSHVPSPSYCPNQLTNAINFVCLPNGGAPIFTWGGMGGIGGIQTGNIAPFLTANTTTLNSVGTFTVYATLNTCKGPNTTFSITVFPNPIAKFSYGHACDGKPTSFFDESYVGNGYFINQWSWNINGIAGASILQNPQYTVTPVGWDSVGLTVHSNSVPSCTATVKEDIYVNPNPVVNFVGFNLTGCPNVNTAFTDQSTISSGTIQSWNWSFGNNQTSNLHYPPPQTYTNTSPTTPQFYSVSLTVATDSGCVATHSVANYIEVYPKPIADFNWGPQDANLDNPIITFYNQATGYAPYTPTHQYGAFGVEYNIGDTYNTGSNIVYNNTTFAHPYNYSDPADVAQTYNVTQWVINSYGCTDSITKPVVIQPIFTFYAPNCFTPNGDGKNDGFKGIGEGIDNTTYNMWIFDRWGLMIYHVEDINTTWDGHMHGDESKPTLLEDVYVWKVKFNDIFGTQHEYHGTVTLLK